MQGITSCKIRRRAISKAALWPSFPSCRLHQCKFYNLTDQLDASSLLYLHSYLLHQVLTHCCSLPSICPAMTAAEDLNDWEIVDPITPPQNFEDASARLDEGLGSSSSASEPQPKNEKSPKPPSKSPESEIGQRKYTPPTQGSLVARAVQAIEQAISNETERPYTHEGSSSRQTWEHIQWTQDRQIKPAGCSAPVALAGHNERRGKLFH